MYLFQEESRDGSEPTIYTNLPDPSGVPLQWKELFRVKGYVRGLDIRIGEELKPCHSLSSTPSTPTISTLKFDALITALGFIL